MHFTPFLFPFKILGLNQIIINFSSSLFFFLIGLSLSSLFSIQFFFSLSLFSVELKEKRLKKSKHFFLLRFEKLKENPGNVNKANDTIEHDR